MSHSRKKFHIQRQNMEYPLYVSSTCVTYMLYRVFELNYVSKCIGSSENIFKQNFFNTVLKLS